VIVPATDSPIIPENQAEVQTNCLTSANSPAVAEGEPPAPAAGPAPDLDYFGPTGQVLKGAALHRYLRGMQIVFNDSGAVDDEEHYGRWPELNPRDDCPHCLEDSSVRSPGSRCRMSPNRMYVLCRGRKAAEGAWATARPPKKSAALGGYVHPVGNTEVAMRWGGTPVALSDGRALTCGGKTLLSGERYALKSHVAHLRKSGLTDETIQAAAYTEANAEVMSHELRRPEWERSLTPAIAFPYYDRLGRDTGYRRYRPDDPRVCERVDEGCFVDDKAIKYEAQVGEPARIYFPPPGMLAGRGLNDPAVPLVVVEGEKKCLAVLQAGLCCIGLPGVAMWSAKRPEESPLATRELHPDLAALPWDGRDVYIVFDSDAATNENVAAERHLLARQLVALGARVRLVDLPPGEQKNDADGEPEKVGADDFVVAKGEAEFLRLLRAAPLAVNESPLDPFRLARAYLKGQQLRFWDDRFWLWSGRGYCELEPGRLNADIATLAKRAADEANVAAVVVWQQERELTAVKRPVGRPSIKPAARLVTRTVVADAVAALQGLVRLELPEGSPAWIGGDDQECRPPAAELLPLANGLLHLKPDAEGRFRLLPHTPHFFSTRKTLLYPYEPAAAACPAWTKYCDSQWGDDPDTVQLLEELLGYFLSGRTDLQIIVLLIGASRGGKGVLARLLEKLLGNENCAYSSLQSLNGDFGLAQCLGKTLLVLPDNREKGGELNAAAVSKMLAISGGDAVAVNRKGRDEITARLPGRLLVLTNELPRLPDSAGALAGRFVAVHYRTSYLNKEDRQLEPNLAKELPAILTIGLAGLARLEARGRLPEKMPEASAGVLRNLSVSSGPLSTFLRDACVRQRGLFVSCEAAFERYKAWCEQTGTMPVADTAAFGRALRDLVPDLQRKQRAVNGTKCWCYIGLALRQEADDGAEEEAEPAA
jgi:putative DNA primase/helicase